MLATFLAVALVAVLPWQRLEGVAAAVHQPAEQGYGWTAEDRDAWLNLAHARIADRTIPNRDMVGGVPGDRLLTRIPRFESRHAVLVEPQVANPPGGRHVVWLQRLKLEGG